MTEHGWQPVTDASGEVLGWMGSPDDPEILAGERAQARKAAGLRAAAIDQAAGLLMDEAFDVEETWDGAEAAGLPPGLIDAAGNVALVLRKVEQIGYA
jgi:hypothetical protein